MQQLRENAAMISSKLSSQEEDMDSTLGMWTAIQSIDRELGILQQTSESAEKKTKEALTIQTSLLSPTTKPTYMSSMFGSIEEESVSPINNNNNTIIKKVQNIVPDFSSTKENISNQSSNISTNSINRSNRNQDNSKEISNIESGHWGSKLMTRRASLSSDRSLMADMVKSESPQNVNKSKKKVLSFYIDIYL
jgi:hypothetical protein